MSDTKITGEKHKYCVDNAKVGAPSADGNVVHVKSHTRADGMYVCAHTR